MQTAEGLWSSPRYESELINQSLAWVCSQSLPPLLAKQMDSAFLMKTLQGNGGKVSNTSDETSRRELQPPAKKPTAPAKSGIWPARPWRQERFSLRGRFTADRETFLGETMGCRSTQGHAEDIYESGSWGKSNNHPNPGFSIDVRVI